MTVLVSPYVMVFSSETPAQCCHECRFVAVWEIKSYLASTPKIGYACPEHVDNVLYLVDAGIIESTPGIQEPGDVT